MQHLGQVVNRSFGIFLGILFYLVTSTYAADQSTEEESTSYTVSPTGKYLFATTYLTLYVIETDHPRDRTEIGQEDFVEGGKGFGGIYCSPNEEWLCVNFFPGVHETECHLFHHISDGRFDEIKDPDIEKQIEAVYEKAASRGFDLEAIVGEYWKNDSSGLMLSARGRGRKDAKGELLLNSMYVLYDLRNKRPEIASEETFSPAFVPSDSNEDEKDHHRHPRSDRIEEEGAQIGQASLESQLNVIYNLFKKKLDAQSDAALVTEEKQWLTQRDKLDPRHSDRGEFTQERIDTLCARFIQQQ